MYGCKKSKAHAAKDDIMEMGNHKIGIGNMNIGCKGALS